MSISRLTPGRRKSVELTIKVLSVFRAQDPDMTLGAAVAFLYAAIADDTDSMVTIAKRAGLLEQSFSRYAKRFGEQPLRDGRTGLGLLKRHPAFSNEREKSISLAPMGELLLMEIEEALSLRSQAVNE